MQAPCKRTYARFSKQLFLNGMFYIMTLLLLGVEVGLI